MGDDDELKRLGPPWVLEVDDPLPSAILPEGRPGGIVAVVAGVSMRAAQGIRLNPRS